MNVATKAMVPGWLQTITAQAFASATAIRGKRPFHPRGVVRSGNAAMTVPGQALFAGDRSAIVIRFSRGVGLPSGIADINGLAVRFKTADEGPDRDVLLASVGEGVFRRFLKPAVAFTSTSFSSIVRYRLDGEPVVLTANVRGEDLTLDALANGAAACIDLQATNGQVTELLATINVDQGQFADDPDIRFNPLGGSDDRFEALGFLNALRAPAYEASQSSRRKFAHEPGITTE